MGDEKKRRERERLKQKKRQSEKKPASKLLLAAAPLSQKFAFDSIAVTPRGHGLSGLIKTLISNGREKHAPDFRG